MNGDSLSTVMPSVNSYVHSSVLATDVVYRYSVIASSCAGNSAPSNQTSVSVQSKLLLLLLLLLLFTSLITLYSIRLFIGYYRSNASVPQLCRGDRRTDSQMGMCACIAMNG